MIHAGEVVTEVVGQEKRINKFAVEIPARVPSKHERINQISQIIKANKDKKITFLQVLVNACHCTLNKKHNYILDNASRMIKPSQLFEYLGVVITGGVRCIICKEPIEYDILPYHLEDHKLSLDNISKLFEMNFQDFNFTNNQFYYLGEKIDEQWKT